MALRIGEAFASFFVDGLVAVDDETRRSYETRLPWIRGKIQVIRNGFWFDDKNLGEPGSRFFDDIPSGAKIVLFGGRLSREKNLGLLFDSFAEVRHRVPSAFLVVVGEGPEESALRARADTLGVTRFLFVPVVDQRSLFNLIRQAAVVAIPSYVESGPFIAIEAICLGTPVVGTPVGRLAEILSRWEVGIIVRPEQESFASGLYQILERGKGYYASNCRAAAGALSFEVTFRETAQVYARVTSWQGT
jgi:glycosyltransferase involved in cell wall biosynthesis